MKILIVLRKLKGGVGRANTEIAEVLRKKGHEVNFLSREDNLRIYSLFRSIFPLRKKIKQLIKEKDYDIVYTQDYSMAFPLLFPYPLFWKKHFCCFCGIKTIKNLESSEAGKRYRILYFYHIALHRFIGKIMGKKLVVIGDQLKKIFPKATLIYRGVNLEKFKPFNKKRNFLGWYFSDNEIISLEEIKRISKNVKIKPLIAKNIPIEKMNDFYNKCKIFINIPRTAGFNLSWLESMAAGVPIIIGNYKGAGSFLPIDKISDNENKYNKILRIIRNPKKRNYRKWLIENKFTWENKTEELIKFFEKSI